MSQRRTCSCDFRLSAVKKVLEQGLSASVVGNDLGVGANLIYKWRKKLEEDGTLATEIANSSSVEAELKRLREQNGN